MHYADVVHSYFTLWIHLIIQDGCSDNRIFFYVHLYKFCTCLDINKTPFAIEEKCNILSPRKRTVMIPTNID